MKYSVEDKAKEIRLPGIGETWCHTPREHVYIRIRDDQGKRALGRSPKGYHHIYSVDIETGEVRETPISVLNTAVVLVPKGGQATFVPA